MKQFLSLLKIDLINSFALNKNFGRNKKKSNKSNGLAGTILVFAILLATSFMYAFMIGFSAKTAGKVEFILVYGITGGTLVTLMMTFANAYGILFKSRDFELLSSLPIKESYIVASKLASLTMVGYAYFGIMYVPSLIFYLFNGTVSLVFVLVSILVFILSPLIVTSVCSFIAYIFGRIVSRFKNKNTISTILYTVFIVLLIGGIYAISFSMPRSDDQTQIAAYFDKIYNLITSIYPLSEIAVKAMFGSIIHLLIYIGVMVIPYIIFTIIISLKYTYINNHARDSYKAGNFDINSEKKNGEKSSVMRCLLHKEARTMFATPVYLLNVVIGPIMGTAMVVFISYMMSGNSSVIQTGDTPVPATMGANIVCAISLLLSGVAPASACSISMEGKKFWIIKSLPIEEKKYLNSKLLFSYLIMGPVMLIGTIIGSIIIKATILDAICIVLVSQVSALFYSIIGLLLNLKFYNLEWDNPTQAVKQGANVFLPMIIDFGIFTHLMGIAIVGMIFDISLTWAILIIMCVLCFIFLLVLKKHRISLYSKIAA